MSGLFQSYKLALIDSSFYFRPFSEEVRSSLAEIAVYVGQSFQDEAQQIKKVLSADRKTVYEDNLRFLNQDVGLHTLNLSSDGDFAKRLQNDTWGLLKLLEELKAKFVLLTADQLLIQRVIMNDLNVDLYELNTDRFIYKEEFPLFQRQYELMPEARLTIPEDFRAEEQMVLYRKGKPDVILGKEIRSGLEATLHHVKDQTGMVAKIFKRGMLRKDKFDSLLKLQGINERMDISWALFPLDILYYDSAKQFPAGFTQSYLETKENLDDNPLYLGDLPDEYLDTRLSATVELALKVVRQVRYLNQYGFFISDYNMGNFAIRNDTDSVIQLWDTDSFGYSQFFSGYSSGYRTSQTYDTSCKTGAIEYCNEALYLFVFSLLSLGDAPISEFSGKFKYDKPDYQLMYRKNLIPERLWELFEEVFRGEKVASVEVLLQYLAETLEELNADPDKNKTYQELLDDVWDEEEDEDEADDEEKKEAHPEDKKMPSWMPAVIAAAAIAAAASYFLFFV